MSSATTISRVSSLLSHVAKVSPVAASRIVVGRVDAQGHVQAIAHGHEASQQVGRSALQAEVLAGPLGNIALPEDGAVESVAGDETPVRRQLDRRPRAFVQNVEQAAVGGYQRSHAGHVVVMPRPARTAEPLQPLGRRDQRVVAGGIAVGTMEVMRPVVHLLRPGLDRLLPLTVTLLQHDTAGRATTRSNSSMEACPASSATMRFTKLSTYGSRCPSQRSTVTAP